MDLAESQFEDEVRRIARLLWPTAEFDGATMRNTPSRSCPLKSSSDAVAAFTLADREGEQLRTVMYVGLQPCQFLLERRI